MNANATIYYHDIGDYLTREQKLARIREFGSVGAMLKAGAFTILQPNKHGDWINHRDEGYEELIPLAPERKFDVDTHSVFTAMSNGIKTNRDAWNWNSSRTSLAKNITNTVDFYNTQVDGYMAAKVREPKLEIGAYVGYDSTRFSWDRSQKNDAANGKTYKFNESDIREGAYRPFFKQHLNFYTPLNNCVYRLPTFFPTPKHENMLICVSNGQVLMADCLVDLHFNGDSQCFPLYWYEKREQTEQMNLFDTGEEYVRRDGISDFILERVKELCGPKVTKQDIFYYVYGVLHSEEYRKKYAVNLRKTLPRLPLPEDPKLFWAFSKAGAKLAELHLHYETLPPWKDLKEDSPKAKPSYRVTKMRFGKEGKDENKTAIVYNDDVTVWNIPLEAYDYVVNGKSAVEWIMERYQVTKHKESGIVNDPNLWCDEHNQPRYIIDLLKRIVTLSVETMKIVKALPKMEL